MAAYSFEGLLSLNSYNYYKTRLKNLSNNLGIQIKYLALNIFFI